jgi:hypothetical protein
VFSPRFLEFVNTRTKIALLCMLGACVLIFNSGLAIYWNSFSRILFDRQAGVEKIPPVATYVRNHTDPGVTVLVWGGQAGLNFQSRRDSPTAYLYYPLYVESPFTQRMEDQYLVDLENHPPELIIDAYSAAPDELLSLDPQIRASQIARGVMGQVHRPGNLNEVFDYIQSNYHLETIIGEYAVYRYNH